MKTDPVTVYDGKYTFFLGPDGLLNCDRHGESWPAFRRSKAHLSGSTLALYHDLLDERKTNEILRQSLKEWFNIPEVGAALAVAWANIGGVTITREEYEKTHREQGDSPLARQVGP